MATLKELHQGIRVEPMLTPGGHPNPKQLIIETDDADIFQSYNSIVAVRPHHPEVGEPRVYLGRDWDYSNTTMKFLGKFLGHSAAETRKRIESGDYSYEEDLR